MSRFLVKKAAPVPAPEKFDAQQGNIVSGGSELNTDGPNNTS
jgi:hypothetical protein